MKGWREPATGTGAGDLDRTRSRRAQTPGVGAPRPDGSVRSTIPLHGGSPLFAYRTTLVALALVVATTVALATTAAGQSRPADGAYGVGCRADGSHCLGSFSLAGSGTAVRGFSIRTACGATVVLPPLRVLRTRFAFTGTRRAHGRRWHVRLHGRLTAAGAVGTLRYAARACPARRVGWGAAAIGTAISGGAPPTPVLRSAPPALWNQHTAAFTFSDARDGAAFECSLDGAAAAACVSPAAYSDVADGRHTFSVRARSGGATSPAASASWTVDTLAPSAPTITARPADPSTSRSPTFSFSGSEAGLGFLCSLDGGPATACASPQSYAGVADGAHTFAVQARDGAGNVGPAASTSWHVDATPPPAPTITATPGVSTGATSATFKFKDSDAKATFACSLDGTPPAPCKSPNVYSGLAPGQHRFGVSAVDALGNASGATPWLWTITVASGGSDPVIAAAGDIACDPTSTGFLTGTATSCREAATSDLLVSGGYSAVLLLGDNQYYCGGLAAYQQSFGPTWGRMLGSIYPAPGNHEYLTSGGTGCDATNAGAAGYFTYFASRIPAAHPHWYSYDIGSWHLVSLDSNCGDAGGCSPGSAQYQWLASDLASHSNLCTLAYWHIPLFSSGGRAEVNTLPFWNLLYAAHADVVLTGHDHTYERFAPQDPSGTADPVNGIVEWVAGTGGANHTSFASLAQNSLVFDSSTFGVLRLTLHPTGYDWKFVKDAGDPGSFSDSGSGTCH